ncbi:hypothetical protein GQ53DRAFT_820309 [Thozetella sp. PMI_491]|nr:hypothetical protein GQ53DRAFT_820309 [Thozetella sp. PMI_491]
MRGVADTGVSVVYEPEHSVPLLEYVSNSFLYSADWHGAECGTLSRDSIIFIHGLQGHPFNTWATEGASNAPDVTVSPREDKEFSISSGRSTASSNPSLKLKKTVLGWFGPPRSTYDTLPDEDTSLVFWPRDLLPLQCPEARILVVGYDTIIAKHQFAGAVNKNSIFAHSKNLVNDLSRARPRGRPTLFIAHSLGGIVVKETLAICSASSIDAFSDILKSTAGIVFLGTPHRGSPAAGIAETARKAASVLLMDTNSLVLDSLSLKNSDLERCQDLFSSLWHKHHFVVKTFQEGLPLKIPLRIGQSKVGKVVPDISSCIGDSRERAEVLDADHRSMCRYASATDPNYLKVSREIRDICSNIIRKHPPKVIAEKNEAYELETTKPNLSYNDREKLEHFRFREMLLRELAIKAPAENSYQWLPETARFTDWMERRKVDSHFGLLQILGKPGSGKSTLMKKMVETTRSSFRSAPGTCVAAYFFNSRGDRLEHCARGMFRALLYQLGNSHPPCLSVFKPYSQDDLAALEEVDPTSYLSVLKTAFGKIFSNKFLAPRRTIIFIDALDECIPGELSRSGYYFGQLTKSAFKASVNLNICLARREYPPITFRDCLEIRIERFNTMDIERYIHQKLEMVDITTDDAELLTEKITERSNGIFLWVVLVMEGILRDFEDGKNTKNILKRTESLPKALEDLFTSLLEEMDPADRYVTLRLFQWAVLATGRLRLHEWHHILAFIRETIPPSLEQWKDSEYYTETDTQLERQIRSLSQGLVEVKAMAETSEVADDAGSLLAGAGSLDSTMGETRVVQPIHESVTQFFVNGHANKAFMKGRGYDFVGDGHLSIMGSCMDYLGIAELDTYVAARERRQLSQKHVSNSLPNPQRVREASFVYTRKQSAPLPRSFSITSFMSSASAHSGDYFGEPATLQGQGTQIGASRPDLVDGESNSGDIEEGAGDDGDFSDWDSSPDIDRELKTEGLHTQSAKSEAGLTSRRSHKSLDTAHRWAHDASHLASQSILEHPLRKAGPDAPQPLGASNRLARTRVVSLPPGPLDNEQPSTATAPTMPNSHIEIDSLLPETALWVRKTAEKGNFEKRPVMFVLGASSESEDEDVDNETRATNPKAAVKGATKSHLRPNSRDAYTNFRKKPAKFMLGSSSGSESNSESDTSGKLSSVGSNDSHTLEGYPALASYAINRAFVHAQAAFQHGANPENVLRKLVSQNRWSRWHVLQEGITNHNTWQGFLRSQGLGSWVSAADEIH